MRWWITIKDKDALKQLAVYSDGDSMDSKMER